MTDLDWSALSGPYVSRRTLLRFAAATGATGFAARLGHVDQARAAPAVLPARQEPKTGGTLRLGFGLTQIPNLDPAQVNLGIVAGELVANLFSSLDPVRRAAWPGRPIWRRHGRSLPTDSSTPSISATA